MRRIGSFNHRSDFPVDATRRAATLVCVAASLSLGATGRAAQQPPVVERVDVGRVVIDARVVDRSGQPVIGLAPNDFEVEIGGQSVRVESVQWIGGDARDHGPLVSTPLAGVIEPSAASRFIVLVVQKSLESRRAIGLLRLLQESGRLFSGLTSSDRVAILSFDSHLKIWLDFTDDLGTARRVLADDVMFHPPPVVESSTEFSLVARLSPTRGRAVSTIEEALRLVGHALEPLPGSKSVVLIGYGFGRFARGLGVVGAHLSPDYVAARDALYAARATVFCLDITNADSHTFEIGLKAVAEDTGGFFLRAHVFTERALDRVAGALVGHYVLFTETPDLDPGTHRIKVGLVREKGTVFARRTYVE